MAKDRVLKQRNRGMREAREQEREKEGERERQNLSVNSVFLQYVYEYSIMMCLI